MKQYIATALLSLALLVVPMLQPAFAAADATSDCQAAIANPNSSKGQVLSGLGATGGDCKDANGVSNLAQTVVSILSLVVGILSVIMIIFSGIKYTTSNGDSGKISNAKSTLIYALVGLAITALAQVLVHTVLSNAAAAG